MPVTVCRISRRGAVTFGGLKVISLLADGLFTVESKLYEESSSTIARAGGFQASHPLLFSIPYVPC